MTWGSDWGIESSTVNLDNIARIYSAKSAFAAIKTNGTVVTWGANSTGGDSSAVIESLLPSDVDIVVRETDLL